VVNRTSLVLVCTLSSYPRCRTVFTVSSRFGQSVVSSLSNTALVVVRADWSLLVTSTTSRSRLDFSFPRLTVASPGVPHNY
ncbi:hypothetical protein L218DRAFT_1081270, partial [Marasmius fiardii PR-910]